MCRPLCDLAALVSRIVNAGHRIAFDGKPKDSVIGSFLRDRISMGLFLRSMRRAEFFDDNIAG
jgi:hypothetical protein